MKNFTKSLFAAGFVSFFVAFSMFMATVSFVHHPQVFAIPVPENRIMYEIFPVDIDPIPTRALPPAMVYYTKPIKLDSKEKDCLARNVFYEAGIESLQGKLAVAHVTWNRVQHTKRWGNTVCSVVYQANQFSWTKDSQKRNKKPHGRLWRDSLEAVDMFVAGARIKHLKNSYYYHADYVKPKWTNNLEYVVKIDSHIFYQYASK